jgi:hypothetical protein
MEKKFSMGIVSIIPLCGISRERWLKFSGVKLFFLFKIDGTEYNYEGRHS